VAAQLLSLYRSAQVLSKALWRPPQALA